MPGGSRHCPVLSCKAEGRETILDVKGRRRGFEAGMGMDRDENRLKVEVYRTETRQSTAGRKRNQERVIKGLPFGGRIRDFHVDDVCNYCGNDGDNYRHNYRHNYFVNYGDYTQDGLEQEDRQ